MSTRLLLLHVAAWSIATLIYLALVVIGLAVISTIGHYLGLGGMVFFCGLAAIANLRAPR